MLGSKQFIEKVINLSFVFSMNNLSESINYLLFDSNFDLQNNWFKESKSKGDSLNMFLVIFKKTWFIETCMHNKIRIILIPHHGLRLLPIIY